MKRAHGFFARVENCDPLKGQMKEFLSSLQFDPKDGEPFYVQIRHGEVDFGKGIKFPPHIEEGLYVTGDKESLESLFKGEVSLAEAIYHHKIQIPGYRQKEPLLVQFSKLLRKGTAVT